MKQDLRAAAATLVPLERAEVALGEELHGTLCQVLAGAAFLVEVLVQNSKAERGKQLRDLRKLKAALDLAAREVRFIMQPSVLQPDGLLPALTGLAARISLRIPCQFQTTINHLAIDERKSRVLYRLAKTVLAFLARAEGGKIVLRVSRVARKGPCRLTISRRLTPSASALLAWNKHDLLTMRNCALAVGIRLVMVDPPRGSYRAVFEFDL